LPELPLQYSDYSVWQRNVFAENYLSDKVAYWQQQLEGIQVLELPADFKRSSVTSGRAEYLHAKVGDDRLATDIKSLSHREEVTVFMTLLASFKVLLSRYSAQRDIAVGTLVANRLQPETEQLIGPFDNKLVLRTDLSGNPTFHELLQRVRTTVLNAYANQGVPFEQLVERFQAVRDLRRSPLFQIAFQLAAGPTENLRMGTMQVRVLPVDRATTELDLHVRFEERNGLWFCTAAFLRDLFTIETIRRMLRHWEQMLNTIISEPESHIFDVEMVSRAEREQIIVGWNRSQTTYPQITVHEVFEECVRTMPKGIAVACQSRELTYEQLNDQANQLGHYLQKLGVGPERIVGICMDRGVEMLVAMLAVLKVG
jgi:non-ribosomal peptide synthetase component F